MSRIQKNFTLAAVILPFVAFIAAIAWIASMGTIALASLAGPGALVPVMLIAFPLALLGFALQIIALVQMRGAA